MGKKDAEKAAEAPAEEKNDDKKGDKKDVKKDDSPENVEQDADKKQFDGFLSGKKPNGKSRRCTDCLCLIMVVRLETLRACCKGALRVILASLCASCARLSTRLHNPAAAWVFAFFGCRALVHFLLACVLHGARVCGVGGESQSLRRCSAGWSRPSSGSRPWRKATCRSYWGGSITPDASAGTVDLW